MEKGGSHRVQDRVNKGVSKHSDVCIGYELLYRQSVIGWHVLIQNPPISRTVLAVPFFTPCSLIRISI